MSNISDFSLFSDKTILNTIGLFVQQTRIKQNLNQQELADRAAVSKSTREFVGTWRKYLFN